MGDRAERQGAAPSDEDVFTHFADVQIDRDNLEHYRALMTGRLIINRCGDCGWWIYPHRPMCPECLSWNVAPAEVSGRGQVYMFTMLHQLRDPNRPLAEPMGLAAIELAEQPGLRYLSRVVGTAGKAPWHGMPVRLTWVEEHGPDNTIRHWPAFAAEGETAGG